MIAIDWGTSSFRAYRLDGQGNVVDARASGNGIMATPPGPEVLEQEIGDWLDDGPIVMSGMVGSRQGWVEAPYVPCPAGFGEIASALVEVHWKSHRAWIVPGVSCRDAAGVADVMRGEETQILGCGVDGTICLPGTHSKWVEVRGGRIERFSTAMTGEVYAVLKQHSILGRMMDKSVAAGAAGDEAFAQGVRRSGDGGGLLHHLFGVRTRGLMGELTPAASASYLSGVLIGHELRSRATREVLLLGAPALTTLYARAAALLGVGTRTLDADAAVRCLFRLASSRA